MRIRDALLVVGALLALGCGDDGDAADAGPGAGLDAGPRPGVDAGPGPDAGPGDGMDAGPGERTDAGPGVDAGPPDWPDGGGVSDPEWVDLTVGEPGDCEALVPCGGDVRGVWDVTGGCFELEIESAIADCPGAAVTRREGRGRGRVVFGDAFAHRVADAVVEVGVMLPAICAAFVSCDTIESLIAPRVTEASCETDAAGNCVCLARSVTHIDDMDLYSVEDTHIVSTTSGKRWEFCIDGDGLRYHDVSPSGTLEPGIVELGRR